MHRKILTVDIAIALICAVITLLLFSPTLRYEVTNFIYQYQALTAGLIAFLGAIVNYRELVKHRNNQARVNAESNSRARVYYIIRMHDVCSENISYCNQIFDCIAQNKSINFDSPQSNKSTIDGILQYGDIEEQRIAICLVRLMQVIAALSKNNDWERACKQSNTESLGFANFYYKHGPRDLLYRRVFCLYFISNDLFRSIRSETPNLRLNKPKLESIERYSHIIDRSTQISYSHAAAFISEISPKEMTDFCDDEIRQYSRFSRP